MTNSPISRRGLLASAAAMAVGCGPRKAPRFFGFCFVANREGRSISAIDLSRFRLRRQLALDAAPEQILPHPNPKVAKAYALAPQNGTIYEIDANTLTIARRARAGNTAVGMRVSPDGKTLWVLYRDPARLVELSFDSLRPTRQVQLPAPCDDFDLSRSADEACMISRSSSIVAVASLATGNISRTIAAPVEPSIVRYRFDGKQLITGSHADHSLTIYDTASGKTVVRLPVSVAPRNFCFTELGGQLYITGDGMDAVVTVYPYRTEVAETRLAGHAPAGMAVSEGSPFASYLMVANPQNDAVTVLDVYSGQLTAVVSVGKGPRAIVITPDKEYALVLNQESGDMAVIWLKTLAGNQAGGVRVRRYKSAPIFTMVPVGAGPVSAAVVALT